MRWKLGLLIVLVLSGAVHGQENRLWFVDVEVTGPLAGAVLDAGADGQTRLEAELLAGERRRLRVPVPVRSPLGRQSLDTVPLPESNVAGAHVLGWSEDQPDDLWRRLSPGLRARSRPPLAEGGPRRAVGGLLAVLASFALGWSARRRPAVLVVVSVAGAAAAGGLAWQQVLRRASVSVLEAEASRPVVRVVAEPETANVDPDSGDGPVDGLLRLELDPAGSRMEMIGDGSTWSFRAPGRIVTWWEAGGRIDTVDDLVDSGSPPGHPFEAVWVKDLEGRWTFRGAWRQGNLPDEREGRQPPGWLKAGLPTGTTVVLGLLDPSGKMPPSTGLHWLRVTGLELP